MCADCCISRCALCDIRYSLLYVAPRVCMSLRRGTTVPVVCRAVCFCLKAAGRYASTSLARHGGRLGTCDELPCTGTQGVSVCVCVCVSLAATYATAAVLLSLEWRCNDHSSTACFFSRLKCTCVERRCRILISRIDMFLASFFPQENHAADWWYLSSED